jgi:hypothetical protein
MLLKWKYILNDADMTVKVEISVAMKQSEPDSSKKRQKSVMDISAPVTLSWFSSWSYFKPQSITDGHI